jgi:hypothetical protein
MPLCSAFIFLVAVQKRIELPCRPRPGAPVGSTRDELDQAFPSASSELAVQQEDANEAPPSSEAGALVRDRKYLVIYKYLCAVKSIVIIRAVCAKPIFIVLRMRMLNLP